MPSLRISALVLALAASCASPDEFGPEADPALDTGEVSEASSLCDGATVCSGAGSMFTSTYRVGSGTASVGELAQSFVAPVGGVPQSLRLSVRGLRVPSPGASYALHAEIYEIADPLVPPLFSGAVLAEGSVPLASIGSAPIEIPLTGGALAANGAYAFRLRTDLLDSGDTHSTLLGVAAFVTESYSPGHAFRRGLRIGAPTETRLRDAGALDIAFALTIGGCAPGFADCDGLSGCEIDTRSDRFNCNACGNACPFGPNLVSACALGVCQPAVCESGFLDCTPTPGCETNGQTDLSNCGSCGHFCSDAPQATGQCAAGTCQIVCNPGFADCDAESSNGCETDLTANGGHCP